MSATQSGGRYGRLPPEICEMILLRLDLRTLLTTATRVCHAWALMIQDSPAMQQKLFLAPDTQRSPDDKEYNTLLVEAFPSIFINHQSGAIKEGYDHIKIENFTLTTWDLIKHPEKRPYYMRPDASWRRMLLQQPPIWKIGVWATHFSYVALQDYYQIPEDLALTQNGIRMETIVEEICFSLSLRLKDLPMIIWPENCSWSKDGIKELEGYRHRKFGSGKLGVGIILGYSTSGPYCGGDLPETESKEEEEARMQEEEDMRTLQNAYRMQGLKPKVEEPGWRSEKETYDWL